MRKFRTALLVLLPALLSSASAAGKPNILFFFVDDMGWQDTSVPFHTAPTTLNRQYRTPNMARLAKKGLLFTNAYACAICSPSRVSLMTGQNAARHGVTCWTLRKDRSPEQANKKLSPSQWPLNGLQPLGSNIKRSFTANTLPARLREAGYRTIHAGKAHFGAQDTPGSDPKTLGFDINIAGSHIGGPGSYHGDKNFSAKFRNGDPIWDVPGLEKYHGQKINLTEAITREAISAVAKSVREDTPFYLYMAHYAVHAPFEPNRKFLPNYQKEKWKKHQKTYASMLEGMDHSLGQLLDTLDQLKITDNTIVIFMSDNGSPGTNPQNIPLKGSKISGYEGGTRVPLIVHWPNVTPKNQRTDSPVIIEDIYPTFLEFAGVELTEKIDGRSFTDILKNPATDRSGRPLFWHYPNLYHLPPYSSVRLGDHKLIHWHLNGKLELFDLKNDIGEKTNLAPQQPQKVNKLATLLGDHLRETKAFRLTKKDSNIPVPYPDKL